MAPERMRQAVLTVTFPITGLRQHRAISEWCPARPGEGTEGTGLWKLTSCGKLLRIFPQDLENASRFCQRKEREKHTRTTGEGSTSRGR